MKIHLLSEKDYAYTDYMEDIAEITHRLEYLFLKTIIAGLRDETISIPQAKELAIEFRALEPFSSMDDARTKIMEYRRKNTQFTDLQDYLDAYHDEKSVNQKIEQMRKHMQQNNIDAAIHVART